MDQLESFPYIDLDSDEIIFSEADVLIHTQVADQILIRAMAQKKITYAEFYAGNLTSQYDPPDAPYISSIILIKALKSSTPINMDLFRYVIERVLHLQPVGMSCDVEDKDKPKRYTVED